VSYFDIALGSSVLPSAFLSLSSFCILYCPWILTSTWHTGIDAIGRVVAAARLGGTKKMGHSYKKSLEGSSGINI
jgi:hypothetical protein